MKNQSELISKFSNIYIMLLYSIMTNDLSRVKHFLSTELYDHYLNIVNENIKKQERQMYDELNVYKIEILKTEKKDSKEVVTVKIISRYMDYIIDNNTKKIKNGSNKYRLEKENILIFEKPINNKERKQVITCPNCGANLDIHFTGICSYCKRSIDLSEYEYTLVGLSSKKI